MLHENCDLYGPRYNFTFSALNFEKYFGRESDLRPLAFQCFNFFLPFLFSFSHLFAAVSQHIKIKINIVQ